jgi:hypothetical protein
VGKLRAFVQRLSHEPPFRLSTKVAVKRFSTSVRTKGCWDVAVRPQYLADLLAAADDALRDGVEEISAFELEPRVETGCLRWQLAAAEDPSRVASEKACIWCFHALLGIGGRESRIRRSVRSIPHHNLREEMAKKHSWLPAKTLGQNLDGSRFAAVLLGRKSFTFIILLS